jgi:hypothetical protein
MQQPDEGGETVTQGAGADSDFRRIGPGVVGTGELQIKHVNVMGNKQISQIVVFPFRPI